MKYPSLTARTTMCPRLLKACRTFAVTSGLVVPASIASAGSVSLSFNQTTSSSPVSVTVVSGPAAGTYNNVEPGPYYWTDGSGNPTTSFCVQLNQEIVPGNTYTFSETPVSLASELSSSQVTAISELYSGHYSTTWESTGFAGSDASAAFQLALWAIIYDGSGSYDLSTGNFQVTSASSTAVSTAQGWLDSLAVRPEVVSALPVGQITYLYNSTAQNQVVLSPPPPAGVPAPSGAILAGIGVLGLIGRARRAARPSASGRA